MRTFKTVLGLQYEDSDGNTCASFQLVCEQDGKAYATADFRGGTLERYLCADSALIEGEAFRKALTVKNGQPGEWGFKVGEAYPA